MITATAVTKSYGPAVVVDGVHLTIPRGGLTCLVGPNGAGKSTLLSVIARLLRADSGTVVLDDLDVHRADSREVARRLAMLRQENHVTVRLTVRDLVSFGRFPHRGRRPSAVDEAAVDEALAHLELTSLAGRYLDQLSGGQRQRAFVAMTLAQESDYLLLDEPLNNLDMRHAQAMLDLLRRAVDRLGRTVVVVVHDINAAAVFADRIVAMRDGRIVADGPPAEVMDPGVLRAVFDVPVTVAQVNGVAVAVPYTR